MIVPKKIWYYKWYYKLIYLFCSGIVQDSDVSKQAGIQYGAPIKNNEIIDIGVDFSLFNPDIKEGYIRNKFGLSKNDIIILQPRGFRKIYNNEIILKSVYPKKRLGFYFDKRKLDGVNTIPFGFGCVSSL